MNSTDSLEFFPSEVNMLDGVSILVPCLMYSNYLGYNLQQHICLKHYMHNDPIFDRTITDMAGSSFDEHGKDAPEGKFQELASKSVEGEKWGVIPTSLTGAAKSVLGVEKCRHRTGSRIVLTPLSPFSKLVNLSYC